MAPTSLDHLQWFYNTQCSPSNSPRRNDYPTPEFHLKPLYDSRSDRYPTFGPTEIIKLIYVFDLGATDLDHSVTLSCNNCIQFCISVPPSCSTRSHRQGHDIYTVGSKFGNSSKTSARACPALPPRVSGSSSHRQRPPAAGLRRRQRNSTPPLPP